MSITYRRAGRTQRTWQIESLGPAFLDRSAEGKVAIGFKIAAPGGGETHLEVRVAPSSFDELAKLMVAADPVAAIKAFGKALEDASIRRR